MAAIGSIVDVAPSTVYKRIEKLKKTGIIERFTIVVNPKASEHALVAFLSMRVDPDGRAEIEDFMRDHPDILEVYEVLEPGDFIAKVQVQDIGALKQTVLMPLSDLPGVEEIQTIISVRKIKERS